MRGTWIRLGLFALLVPIAGARAEDTISTPAQSSPQPATATNTVMPAPEIRTTWKGLLFAAPTNSAAGVVAVLKQEKHRKIGACLLRTEDPVLATRLRDLSHSHKGTAVVLKGELDPDGTTILVTDLFDLPKERKPERK